jgi:hypothetical protein
MVVIIVRGEMIDQPPKKLRNYSFLLTVSYPQLYFPQKVKKRYRRGAKRSASGSTVQYTLPLQALCHNPYIQWKECLCSAVYSIQYTKGTFSSESLTIRWASAMASAS